MPARLEAHLVALKPAAIRIGGKEMTVASGDSIRTDVSWKYDPKRFERVLSAAGWATKCTCSFHPMRAVMRGHGERGTWAAAGQPRECGPSRNYGS
ncbi:MAG: L-histidine N(alpha)-methyltransferase [Rhodomicrobium sp.]